MRAKIRELMESRENELQNKEKQSKPMADEKGVYLSPQELQNLLQAAIAGALSTPRGMTPLEQKQFEKESEQETRRKRMYFFYAKAEAEADARKKAGCTHMRDPKTGDMVPQGQFGGEWRTGGQLHANNTASLLCLMCGYTWTFKVTNQERDALEQRGMLRLAPPAEKYCIVSCTTCGELVTNEELNAHKGPCRVKYDQEMAIIDAKIQERQAVPV